MAQYGIIYQCGHSETQQLYGSGKDRARRIAWLKGQECRACQRAAHDGDNLEASVLSRIEGLPRLNGTPKQIAWAETIRRAKLAELDALIAQAQADPRAQEEPSLMALYHKLAGLVRQQTSAATWIDYQHVSAQTLLQQANAGLGRHT